MNNTQMAYGDGKEQCVYRLADLTMSWEGIRNCYEPVPASPGIPSCLT